MLHIRLFIGIIGIIFFVATFEFIRKRHLREEYAILWLFTSSIVAILSLWPGLINVLSKVTGLYYITAVLTIVFSFVIAVLMHYSIAISKIKEMNKELTQKCALLELRVRQLEGGANTVGGTLLRKTKGERGVPPQALAEKMERATGLEPATSSLGSLHSTN